MSAISISPYSLRDIVLDLVKLNAQRCRKLAVEDVLRALHRGLGAAALGLALGQSPVQPLDDGNKRLAAVLLEKKKKIALPFN